MSSTEIKNTIGLLCKLLNLMYNTNLKSEYFRLAKFNKSDENVVPILWSTLCTILNDNKLISIKNKFVELNYKRRQFYNENPGSRELLLALIFLVTNKMEKDLENLLENGPEIENFSTSTINNDHEKFNYKKLVGHDLENYVKWLEGKILSNGKMKLEYEEKIAKIQEKYNKNFNIKAHASLSIYEILALKNKEFGKQFIQDTESIIHILNIYIEWTKKEKQFWKWMSSVLNEAN